MGYADSIYKLEALPRGKQQEVFEFIDFLSERFGGSVSRSHGQAEVAAQAWNIFSERFGSFADQYSTL
jgi:hypothetical protein